MTRIMLAAVVAGVCVGCATLRRGSARAVPQVEALADGWDGDTAFPDVKDPWGRRIIGSSVPGEDGTKVIEVRSAGPDAVPDTADDVVARRRVRRTHPEVPPAPQ